MLYIIVFFPLAIIYAFPAARGKLSASLSVRLDGNVTEYGGAIAEMEKAQKRSKVTGWVVLGLIAAAVICVVFATLMNK